MSVRSLEGQGKDNNEIARVVSKPLEVQNSLEGDLNKENKAPAVKKRSKQWGPIIPERRSKRHPQGGDNARKSTSPEGEEQPGDF